MSRSGSPRIPMTHWSRYDIEKLNSKNSDHWTKMKVNSSSPNAVIIENAENTSVENGANENTKSDRQMRSWSSPPNWYRRKYEGQHLRSCALFDQIVVNGMSGDVPGRNTHAQQLTSRTLLRTPFNQRAKEGFKYWPMDRPKPTKFGRYGMGSYKTVLGIGNAPRT